MTYRPPRTLGEPSAQPNWAGAVAPALMFFVRNVFLFPVHGALAGVAGLVLMVVGVVLLVRNRRRTGV